MNRRGAKRKEARLTSAPALTPRQREILLLITQGYRSREIAEQLGISVQTVEVHRFNLMRRWQVRNVAQLIRQALVWDYVPKGYPKPKVTRTG